jgi:hypothetical protein
MNILRTRTRRGAAILFSGILVLGGLTLAGEATAQQELNNPSCQDLGYVFGQKWEDPSGAYSIDRDGMVANFTVGTYPDVTKDPNTNNAVTAAKIVTKADGYAVIVKGGNGYNLYPNTEAVPMHAPAVPSEKWPTISHFDLCWNKPAPVGSLQVTKVLAGPVPVTDPPTEYEICIEGPAPATTQQCKKVMGAGVVTFEDLKPGTYKVTETPGLGYTAEITPTEPVVVTAGEVPATATVKNTYKAPPVTPPATPPAEEQQSLPPTAPVTPVTPTAPTVAPATEVASATATQTAAPTALPTTGSEGGIAAIAALLVATGVALTLLGRHREQQQA